MNDSDAAHDRPETPTPDPVRGDDPLTPEARDLVRLLGRVLANRWSRRAEVHVEPGMVGTDASGEPDR